MAVVMKTAAEKRKARREARTEQLLRSHARSRKDTRERQTAQRDQRTSELRGLIGRVHS